MTGTGRGEADARLNEGRESRNDDRASWSKQAQSDGLKEVAVLAHERWRSTGKREREREARGRGEGRRRRRIDAKDGEMSFSVTLMSRFTGSIGERKLSGVETSLRSRRPSSSEPSGSPCNASLAWLLLLSSTPQALERSQQSGDAVRARPSKVLIPPSGCPSSSPPHPVARLTTTPEGENEQRYVILTLDAIASYGPGAPP